VLEAAKRDIEVLISIDRELPTNLTGLLPVDFLLLRRHVLLHFARPADYSIRTPPKPGAMAQLELMVLAMARQWITAVPYFIPARMMSGVLHASIPDEFSRPKLPARRIVIFHDALRVSDLFSGKAPACEPPTRVSDASVSSDLVLAWVLFADEEDRVLPIAQVVRAPSVDLVAMEAGIAVSLVSSFSDYLGDAVRRLSAVAAYGEWRRPVPLPPMTCLPWSERWTRSLGSGATRDAVLNGAIPAVWTLQQLPAVMAPADPMET
jgi:hypothetical protein